MKYICENDYEDFFPNTININLANEKGLANDGKLNSIYYMVQSKYYRFFEEFLNKKLNLSSLESLLESKNQNFKAVPEEEMDIYQYLSSLKYFYIRNTLFIENLSREDIKKILDNDEMNDDIENIIATTYKSVIKVSSFKDDEFATNYGPLSSNFIASNDSLILGIRFKEENEDEYSSEDDWFEDYCNRREIIEEFKKFAKELFCTKLACKVEIFEYFSEDVKKKFSNGIKK